MSGGGPLWTRAALEARVDALAREHRGAELVERLRGFAEQLGEPERELLGEVLLERAGREGGFDYALIRRISEPYLKLFRPRPVEPGREPRRRRRRRD